MLFRSFLINFMENYYACVLTIFYCAEVYWRKEMEWAFSRGWEGEKRTYRVPSTPLDNSTMIRSQKTARMNFYKKFAGDLQEVLKAQAKSGF